MIRRLAFIAGCVALSSVVLTGKAHAQLVEIDITGEVTPFCSTANVTAGIMKVDPTNPAVMTTSSAQAPGASRGSFNLTCTGAAQLSVGIPVPQNTLSANVVNYGASLPAINANYAVKGGAAQNGTLNSPISNTIVEVDQFINNNGTPLPVGSYAYKVPVNITPQ